jgi:hypothetical protein
MNCYYCEQVPGPGGMLIRNITADGTCQECGVAVCRQHGRRAPSPGSPLLCEDCAERSEERPLASRQTLSQRA